MKYGEMSFRREACENPSKYLVHSSLDFNTKLQKYVSSALIRSTSEESKK